MKLSLDEVRNVAFLARLDLEDEEMKRLAGHLNEIIGHFSKLQELDTADVEPTARVLPMVNVYREDEAHASLAREDFLRCAPGASEQAFIVPRVVDTADGKSA